MSATKTLGKKKRLQRFVEDHLWNEAEPSKAFAEELNRLSQEHRSLLKRLDTDAIALVSVLLNQMVEYKRALRLALTLSDNTDLPEVDGQLVAHAFKLAGREYRTVKKHGTSTAASNASRQEYSLDFYEPFLNQAYFAHLETHGKFPGRAKLEYRTIKAMQEDGLPQAAIKSLTEYQVKKFLTRKKAAVSSSPGLLDSLIEKH